mgnify:FL=1
MKALLGYGNQIIEPEVGFLASGLEGKGRMEEPDIIVNYLDRYFEEKDLLGKKIMITAGPTYEKIDPCASSATTHRARWALPSPRNVPSVELR